MADTQMTLEEAFSQAIAHHQLGRLPEAEAFYRAILQAVPNHPDANHNLGVIAIQGGRPDAAIPFFSISLDAHPAHLQYRASYIDALIRTGEIEKATRALAEGRNLPRQIVDAFVERIADDPDGTHAKTELLVSLFNQQCYVEAEALARSLATKWPDNGFYWKMLGAAILQLRGAHEALDPLRKTAALSPNDAEAQANLGFILAELGNPWKAAESFRKAVEISPDHAEMHFNLAKALQDSGKTEDAEKYYRRALSIGADFAEAHYNLGNLLKDTGRLAEAESCYLNAIEARRNYAEAYCNLGVVRNETGRLAEAESALLRAIEIRPDFIEAHQNLGNIRKDLGRLAEAESSFRKALQIDPKQTRVLNNLGLVLKDMGRTAEAESCFSRAIEISPDFVGAYWNLGLTLHELGRLVEAEAVCRQSCDISPDYAESYNNLGIVLMDLGRLDEAETCFKRALEIDPASAKAHNNLGRVFCQLGKVREGILSFRAALELDPSFSIAHSNLIFNMDHGPEFDVAAQQAERKKWAALHADHLYQDRHFRNVPAPDRRLRIAYVSADFNDHSASNGFMSLFTRFDKEDFDVYAYFNSIKNDAVTAVLRKHVTEWREVCGLSDEALAELVLKDEIDILVDLSGHTRGNRLLVFARKPAPIQVSAMGYPTGTGMRAMDALFVDEVVAPPEEADLYAEEMRYFPCLIDYSAQKDFPEVNEPPALSRGCITFGSFNRYLKVSDEALSLWSLVVSALPNSRMILKAREFDDAKSRGRVLQHFEKRGVSPERIVFLGGTSWLEHMKAHGEVDISLDPFPHGGGVTTIESIRMGVPVLTLRYPTFVGRASASILTTLGLTDWIAESPDEYVKIAIEKSQNLAALANLRGKLRGVFDASILGDPDYYLRAAEKEYRALWREWCAKEIGPK